MKFENKKLELLLESTEKKCAESNDFVHDLINWAIIIVGLVLTFVILILFLIKGVPLYLYILTTVFTILATSSLYLSTKNVHWVKYPSSFFIVLNTFIVSLFSPFPFSDLISFYNGLAILQTANEFGKKGFFLSSGLIIWKIIGVYGYYGLFSDFHEISASIVNASALGIIPILWKNLRYEAFVAQTEEIKAEIQARKNEKIIATIGDFYKEEKDLQSPHQSVKTDFVDYVSPYSTEQS